MSVCQKYALELSGFDCNFIWSLLHSQSYQPLHGDRGGLTIIVAFHKVKKLSNSWPLATPVVVLVLMMHIKFCTILNIKLPTFPLQVRILRYLSYTKNGTTLYFFWSWNVMNVTLVVADENGLHMLKLLLKVHFAFWLMVVPNVSFLLQKGVGW